MKILLVSLLFALSFGIARADWFVGYDYDGCSVYYSPYYGYYEHCYGYVPLYFGFSFDSFRHRHFDRDDFRGGGRHFGGSNFHGGHFQHRGK